METKSQEEIRRGILTGTFFCERLKFHPRLYTREEAKNLDREGGLYYVKDIHVQAISRNNELFVELRKVLPYCIHFLSEQEAMDVCIEFEEQEYLPVAFIHDAKGNEGISIEEWQKRNRSA